MKKPIDKKNMLKEDSSAYALSYEDKEYTYQDILDFNDDKNYELIDGRLYLMASARPKHQLILGELFGQIREYLKGKQCEVIMAPSDVKLTTNLLARIYNKIRNSVQPDIYVICDTSKFDTTGIYGVPDLIIEILSPSNKKHDTVTKFDLYQKYGVKEYWIVDPDEENIAVFMLDEDNIYKLIGKYDIEDEVKVNILDDLTISLKDFYKGKKELLDRI